MCGEFRDAVLREKLAANPPRGRLVGDGLRAVLTKLEHMALAIGRRPRARLAVETVRLVDVQQRARPANYSHAAE